MPYRLLFYFFAFSSICSAYDPLAKSEADSIKSILLSVDDAARKREIPLKIFLPNDMARTGDLSPVIIFSHGLGGSREGSAFLGKHWAARGYAAVFTQHIGSDTSVWKGQGSEKGIQGMHKAASATNLLLRVQDIPAVINALEKWNADAKHELHNRLDLGRIGMSGHSFGAQTTQAVSGQSLRVFGHRYTDSRIKAAVVMSPGVPQGGDKTAFNSVKIPWLLMTGTKDGSPLGLGGQTIESRRKVFQLLPNGDKYELVLFNAEHSVFTDRALPGEKELRNPEHHKAILAISTAFWDAYIKNDADAKIWLKENGPKAVMDEKDIWQKK